MEIINPNVTLLPNFEVLKVVNEVKAAEAKRTKFERDMNLNTLLHETATYLKATPASSQKDEQVLTIAKELKPYKLTIAESIQVLNLRPSTSVELQLIVEECEERFKTEEQLDNLVKLISETLPEVQEENHVNA